MLFTMTEFFFMTYCTLFDCIPRHPAVTPEARVRTRTERMDLFPGEIPHSPIAQTSKGMLAGYVMRTIRNRPIAAFEGVPYAQPPVGRLRFRSPVPIRPWEGIRHAKRISQPCLQFDLTMYYMTHGSEDCLYANVYSTNLIPTKRLQNLLPVMVFIAGGAYFFGSGGDYGPAYLLDKQDIVLVTFNYRLGILGFLSTGDDVAPGNWGMKDQALLLRWVQRNIASFGGDPKRITLAGQSAGSTSVELHLMSPLTRDIPQQAIMHSGSSLSFWGVLNRTVDSSRLLAQEVNCPVFDSLEMMECLRATNPIVLVSRQFAPRKELIYPMSNFGPVVESPDSKDAFLVESVENAYRNRNFSQVPVLMGLVQDEGEFFVAYSYLYQEFDRLNRDPKSVFPFMFEYQDRSLKQQDEITKHIMKYYLFNKPISFESKWRYSKIFSSRYFNAPIRRSLQLHANLAPTYGYHFNYRGQFSLLESLGLNRRDWNISHLDDMAFLFNSTFFYTPFQTQDKDYFLVDFLTNVWGNFIAKGKPLYTTSRGEEIEFWNPIKPATHPGQIPEVLEIRHDIRMSHFPFEDDYHFWRSFGLT